MFKKFLLQALVLVAFAALAVASSGSSYDYLSGGSSYPSNSGSDDYDDSSSYLSSSLSSSSSSSSTSYSGSAEYGSVYYEGPAWAMEPGSGFVPDAGDTVQIRWTNKGLWIDGEASGLSVGSVGGDGISMMVNGSLKVCNRYVNIGGERYFFVYH